MYIAQRRHAQSETLYNPEQMVTVFKQLVMLLNNFTIFFILLLMESSALSSTHPTATVQKL